MSNLLQKRKLYLFVMFVVFTLFMFTKFIFGELTPDEVFYTTDFVINTDNIDPAYIVINFIFKFLFRVNKYVLPLLNISLVLYVFNKLYKNEVTINRSISKIVVLLLFLPSVIYFASSYLRDIYVFVLGFLLIYNSSVFRKKKYVLIVLLLVGFLRWEASVILILSYLIDRLLTYKGKPIIMVNFFTIPLIILVTWLILYWLFDIQSIWRFCENFINFYEKKNSNYGIFQVPITKTNIISYSVINWVAYYMPFLFKELKSLFDYFIVIDSIIVGILFIRMFLFFDTKSFKKSKIYRVSFYVFVMTFFLALPESVPETMYRHRMAYLPFLIYLNFPYKHDN